MDMLCCLGGDSNPGAAYAAQTSDGFGTYPGNRTRPQRPMAPTGGNALQAAPPMNTGNPDMVYVTVPPNIYPGQSINVVAPDGSGRMVNAVVPNGAMPGSQFMVQLPPLNNNNNFPMATAEPYHNYYNNPSPAAAAPDFAQALDQPYSNVTPMPPPSYSQQQQQQQPQNSGAPGGQKLLLVRVPPGTTPGSTINVAIPDEPGRLIAAQVPPNVTEFHVAYQPRIGQPQQQAQYQQQQQPQYQQQLPKPMIPANTYNNYNSRPNGYNNNGYNNNNNNSRFNNNQGGGGMGGFLLPALGGAALGAAAVGMYDHFGNNDDAGYADTGDFGGGNDFGGDDFGGGDW